MICKGESTNVGAQGIMFSLTTEKKQKKICRQFKKKKKSLTRTKFMSSPHCNVAQLF